MPQTPFFNAHHSPIGAFSSLTLGSKGVKGGLGIELPGPACKPFFVGVECANRPNNFLALPFYEDTHAKNKSEEFDVEGLGAFHRQAAINPFEDKAIERRMGPCVDEWKAQDFTFRIVSPVASIPDPDISDPRAVRDAIVPAIYLQLTLDNRAGLRSRKVFAGYQGSEPSQGMRILERDGLVGIAQGSTTAIATNELDVYAGLAFQPEAILMPSHPANLNFMLGTVGLLVGEVPAGEIRTFQFAVGFFREGTVTSGIETRYLYRRWFDHVEDVVVHALSQADRINESAAAFDARLSMKLSPDRYLMLGQAIRSYYGSTQLLERGDGRPLWVVNEGEYRMMNTFDLTVDQAFFELALNPWTLKNNLDLFVERYAYEDQVRLPGDETLYPGGLVFTHDMGVANCFSPPGTSCYEQAGLRGCFSYMSAEELLNWLLSACLYVNHAKDETWLTIRSETFKKAAESLVNRDHPDVELRTGVIGVDGARCEGGSEITTYDSLDESLGQARNNLYLAVKTWAACILLDPILRRLDLPNLAETISDQASRCAGTIVASCDEHGLLPAIIGEGVESRLIPAIEGLIYPWIVGHREILSIDGRYGDLVRVLIRHFDEVLKSGVCRFPDGGWRLSSSSRNSWLSKIYLSQAIAENVLGRPADSIADRAHLGWLMQPENAFYAWSDQMLEGKAVGSRYYPRGVTAILWLADSRDSGIDSISETLLGETVRQGTAY